MNNTRAPVKRWLARVPKELMAEGDLQAGQWSEIHALCLAEMKLTVWQFGHQRTAWGLWQ